jgi:hypothetical protein
MKVKQRRKPRNLKMKRSLKRLIGSKRQRESPRLRKKKMLKLKNLRPRSALDLRMILWPKELRKLNKK